ncbi:MAG: extracellular solute-binding protein [Alphaproteobacteria bacterium]|nr:MAG: extracellular solute-binding protein [Alphaproteobacteria bacterium]
MKLNKISISVLALSGSILVASMTSASAEDVLSIASWGGSYQDAQSKALFQPAAKEMGITIKEETYGGMSDVRLRSKSGATQWDIVASGSGSAARAAAEGLLEPLDYKVIDVSTFYPGLYTEYCVGSDVYSVVDAWNTKTYGENGPRSWADFFDVKKFPGTRSLRDKYDINFQIALLADGVPKEKVYEVLSTDEGMKRALDKLRELKPHVAVWWKSGAQHAQLMKDGEVDMTTGWNGRFDVVRKDGAKVDYDFNQGFLDYDCFAIPKGAPHKELAMKFLAKISEAKIQANLAKYITYGPANKKAYENGLIDEKVAKTLPSYPANAEKQLRINLDWYTKYGEKASAMFQEMLTE